MSETKTVFETLFKKGHKKLGGRQKGTGNKFKIDAQRIMSDAGFNPIYELMRIVNDVPPLKYRIEALKELAKYYAPQLRSVDISNQDKSLFKFVVNIDKPEELRLPATYDAEIDTSK